MRAAAADAGVSPALVMHHFGSKDGLDLARAVAEGGPAADRLVDRLVVLADQQLARWSATGAVRPSADPQMRAVVLVVWDLAVLVLARHVHRTSGSDPFTAPAGLTR